MIGITGPPDAAAAGPENNGHFPGGPLYGAENGPSGLDPRTGRRGLDVIDALLRTYGHLDLGLYARVEAGGRMAVGDAVKEVR